MLPPQISQMIMQNPQILQEVKEILNTREAKAKISASAEMLKSLAKKNHLTYSCFTQIYRLFTRICSLCPFPLKLPFFSSWDHLATIQKKQPTKKWTYKFDIDSRSKKLRN